MRDGLDATALHQQRSPYCSLSSVERKYLQRKHVSKPSARIQEQSYANATSLESIRSSRSNPVTRIGRADGFPTG